MKKVYTHNPLFRLLAPAGYGFVVYILVLLVFDSIKGLQENFFNQEAYLCVGLSYLIFESFRLVTVLLDKYLPATSHLTRRVIVQVFTTLFVAIIETTGVLYYYFQYHLNIPGFDTELLTFNVIFGLTTFLYNMLYMSVIYLNIQNQAKLDEEHTKQKNLEYQMACFNNEINPELLYSSLETLLDLLYQDEEASETFIDKLSAVYRYILSNKNNELIDLASEINAAENLIYLLNVKHANRITFTNKLPSQMNELLLVPGTLNLMVEHIVGNNIITNRRPLHIKCYNEEEYLVIQVKTNEKLVISDQHTLRNSLQEAYGYYTILPIIEIKAYGDLFIKVPLLKLGTEKVA